jgi:YVTN family beta-propeller protein
VSLSTDRRVGTELLGYRVESLLGRGGMGVVYKAYDPRLKRYVALKLVAPEFSGDERFRERFLRESELAASLEHPNVIPIHDAREVEGRLVIAMRLVEGIDLKQLLQKEGTLDAKRALAICAQVAAALDAAHARGLVHGDVKPSNVLLDPQEHVYLADFGLTRRLAEQGLPVGQGLSLGTPAYVSPEQIEGGEVDGRADLYSLGCVLYECLTGEVPFARDSELAVLWAHVQEEPLRPSERTPALPEAIDAVIAKALAKEPGKRYANCAELVEAAREALGLRELVVVRDRRHLLLAVAGVALAVAAALAAFLLSRGDGGPSKPSTKPTLALEADALQRIDPKTNKLAATFRLGSDPTGVAVGDGAVWVIHLDDNRISKIDPRTNAVVATGSAPGPRAVTVGGGSIWVANGDGAVTQFDPAGANVHGVAIPGTVRPVELAAYGSGAVWIASPLTGFVARINPGSGSVSAAVDTGALRGALKGIAVGEGAVWVSSSDILADDYGVSRLDPATNRVIANVPLRLGAEGVSAGEGAVWVANSLGGSVSQIKPATNTVVRTIPVGEDPVGVAAAGGAVWVTNYKDGTVSRIDPRLGRVVATIRVGPNPDHVATGEGGVWVTVHVR